MALTAGCAKVAIESRMSAASAFSGGSGTSHGIGLSKSRMSDFSARTLGSGNSGLLLGGRGTEPNTPLELLLGEGDRPLGNNGLCPPDMASIEDRFCVDRYEASVVEVFPNGVEKAWSAFEASKGHVVRAVSEPHVFPQGYISGNQAAEACALSGKRLCKPTEWKKACMGPSQSTFGYSEKRQSGRCNDHGKSAMGAIYGAPDSRKRDRGYWSMDRMNNPALNQGPGTLAKSGEHEGCTNDFGVYDMVGNLHEWVADPSGTFQGGYYLDTHLNGDGCSYRTMAHETAYHDYSTGFRCCADVAQ